MYEDEKYTINWLKLFLVVLIAFLVIILSIKLVSIIVRNRDSKGLEVKMQDNLKKLDQTAKDYLKEEKLPKKLGNTNKYSLQKLVDDEVIEVIKDENGKECDMSSSYIEATRLETEYQIKSYLVCGKESNYTNSFVAIEEQERITNDNKSVTTEDGGGAASEVIIIDEPVSEVTTTETTTVSQETTTTTETTKKTTKTTTKARTIKKTYTIAFNVNGGEYLDEIKVDENSTIPNIIPVRKGYKFIGWYYHGSAFNLNTKINQDYVLVAKWVKA